MVDKTYVILLSAC